MRNEVKLANPNMDSPRSKSSRTFGSSASSVRGKMMPTSFELISEGRKLADELGVKLCGLLLGDNVEGIAESIGGYGADEVIVCEHPPAQELHDRRVCQGHLRRHLRDEARGIPHRRDQHRP